jgi:hypothetical protein
VTKFAVEPVWYLPGVAERFGIGTRLSPIRQITADFSLDEGSLRRSLFEHTGGSYPELITRGDIKLFLPPIGMFGTFLPRATLPVHKKIAGLSIPQTFRIFRVRESVLPHSANFRLLLISRTMFIGLMGCRWPHGILLWRPGKNVR